ncbi:MAG: radical SAM protein [Anaerolineae bacterium]|nr:radical SAM protein [Anaerolineae bacterium]
MGITGLGIHLTDRCNARCAHCAYHCGPGVRGAMSAAQASQYLRQAAAWPLEVVSISGGEPCLYLDVVIQVAEEARRLGVPAVWLFTNGFWATSRAATVTRLVRLKRAGVTRLCLSADGFHQSFIPVARVRRALAAGRELGFELLLDVRFLGSPEADNPANSATRQVVAELGDLGEVEVWRAPLRWIGRAAETLAAQGELRAGLPGGACPGPWAGGTWEEPTGVDVDPYGEVTLCPGLSIGNTGERRLSALLAGYRPWRHPIIRQLARGGPAALAEVARSMGYAPRPGYAGECHLCYDVRRFLRPWYPADLAPAICYEEAP